MSTGVFKFPRIEKRRIRKPTSVAIVLGHGIQYMAVRSRAARIAYAHPEDQKTEMPDDEDEDSNEDDESEDEESDEEPAGPGPTYQREVRSCTKPIDTLISDSYLAAAKAATRMPQLQMFRLGALGLTDTDLGIFRASQRVGRAKRPIRLCQGYLVW